MGKKWHLDVEPPGKEEAQQRTASYELNQKNTISYELLSLEDSS